MASVMLLLAALSLAAPSTAPAAPERLDALDFDNGAVLVADGGSYGAGISDWSAWRLTDGDEKKGWCSPQGHPTGLAFVWDLDTTWQLDTFAVSTRHLQEGGYPGISARTLDLLVADGGAFQKVGSFQIAKDERKEFPLPKGTRARQVKVVVAANHGHAEYTEIAELDLFGQRAGPVAPPRIAGDYQTNYGPMRFVQDGDEVYGCYDWTDGAAVWGTVSGRTARVVWHEEPAGHVREGSATFAVTADGELLWGVWYEGGALKGEWAGKRGGERPKCEPRRKGQLAGLRQQKRAVLYGIRFDSNADVPRPESGPTLDQLAAALQGDAALRLLVEGHTDATNSDAYNLDLSQRRAQAVVAALVKRGVAGQRLQAKGFGRVRPVADNATAQGRALNRRVEVSVLE